MAISKRSRKYRLIAESSSKWGGEMLYKFYNIDSYSIYEEYYYRGNDLDLREGNKPLEVGDIIEVEAKHVTPIFKSYSLELKGKVRQTWIRYPKNKRLVREVS